jgi:hypothetical protein
MKRWLILFALLFSGTAYAQPLPVSGQAVDGRYRTVANAESATLMALTNLREGEKLVTLRRSTAHTVGDGSGQVLIYSAGLGGTADNGFLYAAPGGANARLFAADKSYANIQWFNAVPDGSGDQSQEIQAALTAIGNLGGGLVICPRGIYDCGHAVITIPANVTLDGQGSTFENVHVNVPNNNCVVRNLTMHRTDEALIDGLGYHGIQSLSGSDCLLENLRFTVPDPGPTFEPADIDGENAIRVINANRCVLRNFYFSPLSGSAGVLLIGKNIDCDSWYLDYAQDDDGIALKSTTGGDCENWRLSNIYVKGSFAGLTLGSQITGFIRNVTMTNLIAENCNSLVFFKAGYSATDPAYLGGTIENITVNGFTFRTSDPTKVGADHLIWLTARKNSTLRKVSVGNGIISARQLNGAASGSSFMQIQSFDEVGFTNTIQDIDIHDIVMDDAKNGINGAPATDGRHIQQGLRIVEDTPDAGQSDVRNVTIRNVQIRDLGGGFIIKSEFPSAATHSLTGFRIQNLLLDNPCDNPISTDFSRAMDVFDHAGIDEISGLKIYNWSADSKLPGPVAADQEILSAAAPTGTPGIPTPRWLKSEELRIVGDESDIASASPLIFRWRVPTRRYIPRYEFVHKGFQNDATNNNVYIVRRDVATVKTSITILPVQTYAARTANTDYFTCEGLISPDDVAFGAVAFTADAGTAPFTGFDNIRGEKSWYSAGDYLEVWRADNGIGQVEDDLRLRIYYLEF